jgi:hypothetical protein
MRWLHLIVVATLVTAAVDVYKIKFESTVQAERAAKLRAEISRERDTIAALRAQWARLDNPARIQVLAQRHLPLKPIDPAQIDALDRLPERPPAPAPAPPEAATAVADSQETELSTGSTPAESVPALNGSGETR